MVSQDDPRFSHLAVSEAGDVIFSAVRGTVKRFQAEGSMNAMERIVPEIVFCLGGNDINDTDAHPLRLGMDLFQLANKLKNNFHARSSTYRFLSGSGKEEVEASIGGKE